MYENNRPGERQRAGIKGGVRVGAIYEFNAMQVPYLQELVNIGTIDTYYNDLSANMKSNVDYLESHALHVSDDSDSGSSWSSYRYSIVANARGGCYISNNRLYWEFTSEPNANISQINVHSNGRIHIWDKRELSGDYNSFSTFYISAYNTKEELLSALDNKYPITYRDTNCTHSGPDEAAADDTVTVNYAFPDGYGIVNSSDIYVTKNGVIIPSIYADGKLTFKMPASS